MNVVVYFEHYTEFVKSRGLEFVQFIHKVRNALYGLEYDLSNVKIKGGIIF